MSREISVNPSGGPSKLPKYAEGQTPSNTSSKYPKGLSRTPSNNSPLSRSSGASKPYYSPESHRYGRQDRGRSEEPSGWYQNRSSANGSSSTSYSGREPSSSYPAPHTDSIPARLDRFAPRRDEYSSFRSSSPSTSLYTDVPKAPSYDKSRAAKPTTSSYPYPNGDRTVSIQPQSPKSSINSSSGSFLTSKSAPPSARNPFTSGTIESSTAKASPRPAGLVPPQPLHAAPSNTPEHASGASFTPASRSTYSPSVLNSSGPITIALTKPAPSSPAIPVVPPSSDGSPVTPAQNATTVRSGSVPSRSRPTEDAAAQATPSRGQSTLPDFAKRTAASPASGSAQAAPSRSQASTSASAQAAPSRSQAGVPVPRSQSSSTEVPKRAAASPASTKSSNASSTTTSAAPVAGASTTTTTTTQTSNSAGTTFEKVPASHPFANVINGLMADDSAQPEGPAIDIRHVLEMAQKLGKGIVSPTAPSNGTSASSAGAKKSVQVQEPSSAANGQAQLLEAPSARPSSANGAPPIIPSPFEAPPEGVSPTPSPAPILPLQNPVPLRSSLNGNVLSSFNPAAPQQAPISSATRLNTSGLLHSAPQLISTKVNSSLATLYEKHRAEVLARIKPEQVEQANGANNGAEEAVSNAAQMAKFLRHFHATFTASLTPNIETPVKESAAKEGTARVGSRIAISGLSKLKFQALKKLLRAFSPSCEITASDLQHATVFLVDPRRAFDWDQYVAILHNVMVASSEWADLSIETHSMLPIDSFLIPQAKAAHFDPSMLHDRVLFLWHHSQILSHQRANKATEDRIRALIAFACSFLSVPYRTWASSLDTFDQNAIPNHILIVPDWYALSEARFQVPATQFSDTWTYSQLLTYLSTSSAPPPPTQAVHSM